MDHVVELRDSQVRIADQRVVDRMSLGLLDIPHPLLVVADGIHAQSDNFGVALVELRLESGQISKLSGANGREILRV